MYSVCWELRLSVCALGGRQCVCYYVYMLMKSSVVEFAVVAHAVGTPLLICDL